MSSVHPTVETADGRAPTTIHEDVRLASASQPVPTPSSNDQESKQIDSATIVQDDKDEPDDFHPGWRLRAIIAGMIVALILTAFENTAVSVALPVIVADLDLGDNYIWVTNGFFIARYVRACIQPSWCLPDQLRP
jgi:hypothetical protein